MGINPLLLLIVYHLRHFFIVPRSPHFKLLLLPIQLIRLHPLYAPDLFSQLYIWRLLVLPLPPLQPPQRSRKNNNKSRTGHWRDTMAQHSEVTRVVAAPKAVQAGEATCC